MKEIKLIPHALLPHVLFALGHYDTLDIAVTLVGDIDSPYQTHLTEREAEELTAHGIKALCPTCDGEDEIYRIETDPWGHLEENCYDCHCHGRYLTVLEAYYSPSAEDHIGNIHEEAWLDRYVRLG